MARVDIWTYKDLIDHALDYLGAATDQSSERYARRAIQSACMEVQNRRNWTNYYSVAQINTVAPYSTGTIAYDHTGGANERMVTLTGGTWPTWAADGTIYIADVPYQVASRVSGTVITLKDGNNPGADVAASTAYQIARENYTLPVDFGAMDHLVVMDQSISLSYVKPGEFVLGQSTWQGPGSPTSFTIGPDPNRYGVLAISISPAPDAIYPIKFSYRRRSRQLKIDLYSTGTVSITSGVTTLTGTGTSWHSGMVGCIIRFANTGDENVPTGISGSNPFWLERSIVGFTSATSLTLDQDPQQTLSSVKYAISDPVDFEAGAMLTYFLREVERQCRIIRRLKPTSDEEAQYAHAMNQALEADSRHYGPRAAGEVGFLPRRFVDIPVGSDVE